MTKQLRTGFLSYASADRAHVDRFLDIMGPRCLTLRDVTIELWRDRAIVAGERWEEEIMSALERADFGLLCVSPSFLASPYVADVELPRLMTGDRIAIPFALEPLDLSLLDLRGLEALQIFHLDTARGRRRSFADCKEINELRFCDELLRQIVRRLAVRAA